MAEPSPALTLAMEQLAEFRVIDDDAAEARFAKVKQELADYCKSIGQFRDRMDDVEAEVEELRKKKSKPEPSPYSVDPIPRFVLGLRPQRPVIHPQCRWRLT